MQPRFQLIHNRLRQLKTSYGNLDRFVGGQRALEACAEISKWDGYEPTPLLSWPKLAALTGVGSVRCKYEGARFGIGSFKALGGAYAVLKAVDDRLAGVIGPERSLAIREITVVTASDGNHGLSVAWGARRAGCACVIFLHANVSANRQRLIEAMGAVVQRIDGNYDDSTEAAAEAAAKHGWTLVADTAQEYAEHPLRVMSGYGVMVEEIKRQYGAERRLTHLFIQGGCGGLAAAVCGLLRESNNGADAPVVVVVEPEKAACLFESAKSGRPVRIDGELDTVMSGLSVGEVSNIAWPVLQFGVDFFMTISDEMAIFTMQQFAKGASGEAPLEIGDSGIAGIAGFLAANQSSSARESLGLNADSNVLVIATEGPVDRESYDRLIALPVATYRVRPEPDFVVEGSQ